MSYQRRSTGAASLSRPLVTPSWGGTKAVLLRMCLGAATFNLLGSLLGGVIMFLLLLLSPVGDHTIPQILRFCYAPQNSARTEREADAYRRQPGGTHVNLSGFSRTRRSGARNAMVNLSGYGPQFRRPPGDRHRARNPRRDYECLTRQALDGLTNCIESRDAVFDEKHRGQIRSVQTEPPGHPPHTHCAVSRRGCAIRQRIAYSRRKSDNLFFLLSLSFTCPLRHRSAPRAHGDVRAEISRQSADDRLATSRRFSPSLFPCARRAEIAQRNPPCFKRLKASHARQRTCRSAAFSGRKNVGSPESKQ